VGDRDFSAAVCSLLAARVPLKRRGPGEAEVLGFCLRDPVLTLRLQPMVRPSSSICSTTSVEASVCTS
jgi:hypothetical protein